MQGNVPVKRIPWPEDGNPNYPLPPDYTSLTSEGKRQARVAAQRQWMAWPSGSKEQARAFREGVRFFDNYYLMPDIAEDGTLIFDSQFYDQKPYPTPAFHHHLMEAMILYPRLVAVAPRGGAKSFIQKKRMPFMMLTRPTTTITYATSSATNASRVGESIKTQLYYNDRIQDDWLPEYGKIEPGKSEGRKGMDEFSLANRSSFTGFGADSRQRGNRPLLYILDDPEWDSTGSTSMEERNAFMERLIFSVIVPMIADEGRYISWIGTFISQRHYLWKAMEIELDKQGIRRAKDPRFSSWYRAIIPAAREVDGKMISCWPEKWPVDRAQKKELGLPERRVSLEEIREGIGDAQFAAEYMAKPGSAGSTYFPTLTKSRNFYDLVPGTIDHLYHDKPQQSDTQITWKDKDDNTVTMRMKEFLASYPTFATVDTSYTANAASDYKVCQVFALVDNTIFSLDMFAGQVEHHDFLEHIVRLRDLWQCQCLYVEAIHAGLALAQDLQNFMERRSHSDALNVCRVEQIRPGNSLKESRLATLYVRWQDGSIKLPYHRRNEWPYNYLDEQIVGFVPHLEGGGLSHDDCLDTVWMAHFVQKGAALLRTGPEERELTPIERYKEGDRDWNTTARLLATTPFGELLKLIDENRTRLTAQETVL